MGIFGFKNRFDILPKEKDLVSVVTKYSATSVIKLNAKLVVPKNYYFVIGKKGKVCDKFEEGEHFFNYANLPIMCRKFHIDKSKKDKQQDKIPADFYFVNKELRAGKFSTYRKVEMGTKAYGIFTAKVYGVYSYKVSDVNEYMQSLLNEYDYIKTGEAESILEGWVNELVVSELEKQNFILKDVIENNPIIADTLRLKVSKLFSVAGLELVDLKIIKYKLPKKYQAESDVNIEKQNKQAQQNVNVQALEEKNQDLEKLDKGVAKIEQTEDLNNMSLNNKLASSKENGETTQKQEYYELDSIEKDLQDAKDLLKEFGLEKEQKNDVEALQNVQTNDELELIENKDIENEDKNVADEDTQIDENQENGLTEEKTEECENSNLQELEQKDNSIIQNEKTNYVPFGDFVIEEEKSEEVKQKAKKQATEKTFVDLSLNELYNNENKTKRCLNCGMECDINADHCIICGEKFNKGE